MRCVEVADAPSSREQPGVLQASQTFVLRQNQQSGLFDIGTLDCGGENPGLIGRGRQGAG